MSRPAATPPVQPGDAGHPHLCSKDHRWQHAGPSAEGCALPTLDPQTGLLAKVAATDCAVCAGRDELLTRAPHSHHCSFCEVEWIHEGRCVEGLPAWCPWDLTGPDGVTAPGTRIGRHLHYCPHCGTHWAHLEDCAAPLRVTLPSCPGCGTRTQESPQEVEPGGRSVAGQSQFKARRIVRGGPPLEYRDVRAGLPSRARGVLAAIGGVAAAITLVTLGFLLINSPDWLAPARSPRVAVAPSSRSAEPPVSPSPQAMQTPPAESRAGTSGERAPLTGRTVASEAVPADREAGIPNPRESLAAAVRPDPLRPPAAGQHASKPSPPLPVVVLPPRTQAPAVTGTLRDRPPEPSRGVSQQSTITVRPAVPWSAPPPAPPAVLNPPDRPPATPGPGESRVAEFRRERPRELALPSPPVVLPPRAAAPAVATNPGGRAQDPASGTRSAPAPPVAPPVSWSAAPPPLRAERPLPPAAVAPPPIAIPAGASARPNGDLRAPAESRPDVPFARGAPLTGAAPGGAMSPDARRALKARARSVADPATAHPPPVPPEPRVHDAARRAVVRVTPFHTPAGWSGAGERPSRSGFGFIVNENGVVLTAGRLVAGATKVAVTLPDGRRLPVTRIAIDPLNDLAVLQVKAGRLRAVPLGSSRELRVGDAVIALGGPVDGGAVGTVRATGTATGGDLVADARQTGQPRAGLPLLNVRGEAVGVITRTSEAGSGTVLDFAVPIDRAKRMLRDLGPAAARNAFPDVTSDR